MTMSLAPSEYYVKVASDFPFLQALRESLKAARCAMLFVSGFVI